MTLKSWDIANKMVISTVNQPIMDTNVNIIPWAFVAVNASLDLKKQIGNRTQKINHSNANVSGKLRYRFNLIS